MTQVETVSAEEILRSQGAEKPVSEGTFLQRTGLRLAAAVGALGTIVTLALLLKWISLFPSMPVIPVDMDRTKAQVILENYKDLQHIVLEPFSTLFETVVVKVLLPIFTSILGYIFGSQVVAKRSDSR